MSAAPQHATQPPSANAPSAGTPSRRLLLVPADVTAIRARAAQGGSHPRHDFDELARALGASILSWSDVDGCERFSVRLLARLAGRNVALAWLGWTARAATYLTTAENVGMALACLLRLRRRGAVHVMIGHMLSSPRKRPLFRLLGLERAIHALVAYSSRQTRFAVERLGFDEQRTHCIHFHCDQGFFTPDALAVPPVVRDGLVAVGRELRDYPTLVEAVRGLDTRLVIVGDSPWSRRADQLADVGLPENVELRKGLSYEALRQLYASSELAVVPLQDVDSPAGVTSVFEALATATPVVVSGTSGLIDSLAGCDGVQTVPPGDVEALRAALQGLLDAPARRAAMGRAGRQAIEAERSLDAYVERLAGIVEGAEQAEAARRRSRGVFANLSFARLAGSAWPVLSARLWLRRCQSVGRRVRTYGKPRITNLGRMTVGERTTIFSHTVRSEFVAHPQGRIDIGSGVFINYGASISAHERVSIGDGCQIGSYAIMMDNDYHKVGELAAVPQSAPIVLGKNVWLGVRVTILKGVTIGDDAVVGAGSVVTKDVPARCLVAGVPAKVVRRFGVVAGATAAATSEATAAEAEAGASARSGAGERDAVGKTAAVRA